VQQFLSAPVGAEVCGPELTPDQETLFIAVQHPGADGTVEAPLSTFPDGAQPRPAIVSIFRLEGGRIGR
jgi:secreted PhoX family phosphatase